MSKEMSRERRVLQVIEAFTHNWAHTKDLDDPIQKDIGLVYKLAHVGLGRCDPHLDWVEEFKQLEKDLIKTNKLCITEKDE